MTDYVKTLLAKKEAVYATDAAPTPAANAVVTRNFSSKPVETDALNRNLDNRQYGAQPVAPTNERQTCSFEVELAGSGAAGTAPAWMELFEGCGFAPPTLTAATKAEQRMQLASLAQSSLTMVHAIGDQARRMVGARGTASLDFTAGAYPFASLQFTGLIPAANPFTVGAIAGADGTRWKQPVEVGVVQSFVYLAGFAAKVRSLRIDCGVQISVRNLIGDRYINRGNHEMTGQLVLEAPSLAVKDYLTPRRNGEAIALGLVHGTAPGSTIELSAPAVQLTDITESDEDGKLMWTMPLRFLVNAGGDELVVTAR